MTPLDLFACLALGLCALAPSGCTTVEPDELRAILRTHDAPVEEMVALAMAESGGATCAVGVNKDGSRDMGIWQINEYWWSDALRRAGIVGWRTDIVANMRAALFVREVQGWDAWATWRGSARATCSYWMSHGRASCR